MKVERYKIMSVPEHWKVESLSNEEAALQNLQEAEEGIESAQHKDLSSQQW